MNSRRNCRGIYDNCYKGSDIISIASSIADMVMIIRLSDFSKHYENNKRNFIVKVMGSEVDEEKYNLLAEYCSIDHLTVDGELKKMNKVSFEWNKDLFQQSVQSIQLQTVIDTNQRDSLKYHQIHSKYRSEKPIIYVMNSADKQGPTLIPESDILVNIRVYIPFTSRHKQSTGVLGKLSLDCVITISGSQTLDKLRDKIDCPSDYSISKELNKIPVLKKIENAKDIYKSGFFFIENTFYNDFRESKNKDNSKVVREWAGARCCGTFKNAKMEHTRIDSLDLRFGFPWVYQHQGDCEHLLSFSDVRLVNPSDELNMIYYPRIIRIKPKANRYCMTCGLYSVNYVTTSNSRLPHNPCLFCDSCFQSYNYVKGKKIGSFKAYPYPYNSLLDPKLNESRKIKQKFCESKNDFDLNLNSKRCNNLDNSKIKNCSIRELQD